MKLALKILAALVTLVGMVALVGVFLPVGHVAARTVELRQPPEVVFPVLLDVERYPAWWEEVSRVEMLPSAGGRVRFRQHTGTGSLVMEIDESVPATRLVTRIADPDQPFGGTWTFDLEPTASGGSRVTITERGEIYNPIFRALARFVFGYTGTMESCLAALAARFGAGPAD